MKVSIHTAIWIICLTGGLAGCVRDEQKGDPGALNGNPLTLSVPISQEILDRLSRDANLTPDLVQERLEVVLAGFLDLLTNADFRTDTMRLEDAKAYHKHYMDNLDRQRFPNDTAHAVLIELKDILSSIGRHFEASSFEDPKLKNAIAYAYLIRYQDGAHSPDGTPHQDDDTSVLIHLGNYQENADGTVDTVMFARGIYDYGDLCPPKCPKDQDGITIYGREH